MSKMEIQCVCIALIILSILLYGAYIAGNRTNGTAINWTSENGTTGRANELDGNYSFIVYGDTQAPLLTRMEGQRLVACRIAEEKNILFVIHTGDLVDDGNNRTKWDAFFNVTEELLENTSFYPTLGNHDENSTYYYDAFNVSEWYSFDYGNSHFTVLDSNVNEQEQTEWLCGDLDNNARWKFVIFHHPLYSSDPRHYGGWKRDDWEEMFIENNVDVVFNGHMHAYERYKENGIQYVVFGGGGGPLYSLPEDKIEGYQNSFEHTLGYARITVTGDQAKMDVIKVADISEDNKVVTHVYPPNTIFETVVLTK